MTYNTYYFKEHRILTGKTLIITTCAFLVGNSQAER